MHSIKILYGLRQMADYLQGGNVKENCRKWAGLKMVRRLIYEEGFPCVRLRGRSGPWMITERALLEWLDYYGRMQAAERRKEHVESSTTGK